jgi:tRNA threonylcarbamoyladenosine biosynthesis protein TsaE
LTVLSPTEKTTVALGERIGSVLRPGSVVALRGALAAGKTTLTKGIALGLGVTEDVTSPTYTIISEYSGRMRLFHMDAYRLTGTEDFLSIGAEEYLFGTGVCVVEWSERVESALPEGTAVVSLEPLEDGSRRVVIENEYLEEQLR